MNNKSIFTAAFLLGMAVVIWMGANFVGSDGLALSMIILIGIVYTCGFVELIHYRQATLSLNEALTSAKSPVDNLDAWISRLHASLQNPVRLRIEGERVGLPLPVFTPYLVGLLVMLGLLGTFAGMVGTLKGAVFALQGTTELQAIREGLAAPMKGLGLAFGTSVAGVAASAMLGLLSTLARRERQQAVRALDSTLPKAFEAYSLTHHRQRTYNALQDQAKALPEVAERLQSMADQMATMGDQLSKTLIENQENLNRSSLALFKDLAESVDQSLKNSLSDSARLTGENISPIIEAAMTSIGETLQKQTETTQESIALSIAEQLNSLSQTFSQTSSKVSDAWTQGLKSHQDSNSTLLDQLKVQLTESNEQANSSAAKLITDLHSSHNQFAEELAKQNAGKLNEWTAQLTQSQQQLSKQFESSTQQIADNFKAASEAQTELSTQLSNDVTALAETSQQSSTTLLSEITSLLERSDTLISKRMESEQTWLEEQNERIQAISSNLQSELATLRDEEAQRGAQAVERLTTLQTHVTEHLEKLGSGLEAPMTRLIETASETPKAAAEVIGQLRSEIANNIERENQLLEERQDIVESLSQVFTSMEQASEGQRQAIETLVSSSSETLNEVGERFTGHVEGQVDKLVRAGDHFAGSANDMASLGDAFSLSVKLFSETNRELVDSLARIETSLEQSSSRSDEQLGYYVAQAKEIIDHSLLSQKEIFEQLSRVGKQTELGQTTE